MSLLSDLKVVYHLALKRVHGETHGARLENFYAGQAEAYDDFRKRLLRGRQELYDQLVSPPNGVWVELGGGTGANLEFLEDRLNALRRVCLVDLSPSLLRVAEKRCRDRGWTQVELYETDATTFDPGEPVDVVTFSYSLTMIPDWFAAIDQALAMLRPGGMLGVVDFYVSRKYAEPGFRRHGWWARNFWPVWFGNDNVFLSVDHLPYLQRRFETRHLSECQASIPYLPLFRAPYYRWVGVKPISAARV